MLRYYTHLTSAAIKRVTNAWSGVPVLTVGINNSVNAALAAARILGLSDARIRGKVEEYAESAKEESLGKDDKIQNLGWEKYHEQMVER